MVGPEGREFYNLNIKVKDHQKSPSNSSEISYCFRLKEKSFDFWRILNALLAKIHEIQMIFVY